MDTRIYTDLANEKLEFNAYKNDLSFAVHGLNAAELTTLGQCSVAETLFYGNGNFDQSLAGFKNGLKERLLTEKLYLFICEHKPTKISKLKSYKGLIDKKKIANERFIECEILTKSSMSILTAIVNVQFESLEDYLFDFFLDSSISFAFTSGNADFEPRCSFNQELVDQCIFVKETVEINYLQLTLRYCSRGFKFFRVGGDGVGGYWSIQEFFKYKK